MELDNRRDVTVIEEAFPSGTAREVKDQLREVDVAREVENQPREEVVRVVDSKAIVQDVTAREDSRREVEVEREVEPSHQQLIRTELQEVEQASFARRLQCKDGMQSERLEPKLEDTMHLNEILRPFPALIGTPTRTIYSNDLVEVDTNKEGEEAKTIISSKHKGEPSKKRKRNDEITNLDDIRTELYTLREVVNDLVQAQEIMEYNILQKLKFEFAKQKLVVELREDARTDQINNVSDMMNQKLDALSLPSAPVQQTSQAQRIIQTFEATLSMFEFTFVKEDLSEVKTIMQKLQFTFNNTVDIPGLADQVNIFSSSHADLFTILQELNDA